MFEERRLYTRIETRIITELINCMGQMVTAEIINLSEGGLLIEGDDQLAKLVNLQHGVPMDLSICFTLAGELIRCDGAVVYTRRLSQQSFQLGIEFSWLDGLCRRVLQEEVLRVTGVTPCQTVARGMR